MVKIEQIYTGCLAQAAYYIESNGEAAIIDPLRDPKPYLEAAAKAGAKIVYVLETHFHADFVSGHVDLAAAAGATVVYGPTAEPGFDALVVADGQELKVGGCVIRCLHTPGHTMESTTYLLIDEDGKETGIFSGDTLFIGDVGRPDLAQKATSLTQEQLAGHLFRSLRTKVMTLPPHITVYPGHGAGSACGKNMSSETTDTLAHQLETNYALRANMTEAEFVQEVCTGLTAPPEYFPLNVAMNKGQNQSYTAIEEAGRRALTVDELAAAMAADPGMLVIDTRDAAEYVKEYIPGTVFCGIDGGFAPWLGTAHPHLHKQVAFIPKAEGRVDEIISRLTRIGFDNLLGHLPDGIAAWKAAGRATTAMERVTPNDLLTTIKAADAGAGPKPYVIDIRKPGELQKSHFPHAHSLPLSTTAFESVPKEQDVYVYCAGGYRSLIFTSALKNRYGHTGRAIDVEGGFWGIESEEEFRDMLVFGECPNAYRARLAREAAEKEAAAAEANA